MAAHKRALTDETNKGGKFSLSFAFFPNTERWQNCHRVMVPSYNQEPVIVKAESPQPGLKLRLWKAQGTCFDTQKRCNDLLGAPFSKSATRSSLSASTKMAPSNAMKCWEFVTLFEMNRLALACTSATLIKIQIHITRFATRTTRLHSSKALSICLIESTNSRLGNNSWRPALARPCSKRTSITGLSIQWHLRRMASMWQILGTRSPPTAKR